MAEKAPLTAERFDALTRPDKLWTLTAIAAELGVSVDKARRLAKLPGCPIYQPDGQSYFAKRSELAAWLRGKHR